MSEYCNPTNKMYVVVKQAGNNWRWYWQEDPKVTGVFLSASAYHTYTGKDAGISEFYDNMEDALAGLQIMNEANPIGDYAICEVTQ